MPPGPAASAPRRSTCRERCKQAASTLPAASGTAAPPRSTGANSNSVSRAIRRSPGHGAEVERDACSVLGSPAHQRRPKMLRSSLVLGLVAARLANAPVHAVTKQQKLETCTFGADAQKLV